MDRKGVGGGVTCRGAEGKTGVVAAVRAREGRGSGWVNNSATEMLGRHTKGALWAGAGVDLKGHEILKSPGQ